MRRDSNTTLVLMVSFLSALLIVTGQDHGGTQCASTCHEIDCDKMSIRYGKYCGVGHGGCPGEKPCDSIDRCCKGHDECVMKTGLFEANECHKKFIKCISKNKKKDDGFSKQCPYDVVVPTMRQGIEMAMMFTSMSGDDRDEL
ncbi:hypothetical protein CEUSTIGMA_g9592.t1 [Chlamydomonas eustigma]|uniref:Phospholipase A2 domain-containing protein n=1 Tax=Chlamydomonas eustigma TaxID=1157962 RepID=A0A250XGF7_9CHLO|nr:hypothetical protein CEUSTIGMA_g9592.t1 [Chlamydomonas eustigma]|eukprot:GAX82164.1 hypothetical protein CEUSTIGMA_g9592.t1 [Chlamydomonas eustigma]